MMTTEKTQKEELRRLIAQKHGDPFRRCLKTLGDYVFVILAIAVPILAMALGWLKG